MFFCWSDHDRRGVFQNLQYINRESHDLSIFILQKIDGKVFPFYGEVAKVLSHFGIVSTFYQNVIKYHNLFPRLVIMTGIG